MSYQGGQPEWSKDSRNFHETRLRKMGIYSLDRRRLCRDLIETFKIITGNEHVNSSNFLSGLRGHSLKLFKPRYRTTNNQTELLLVIPVNKLPQEVVDAPPINSFKNRLDRHWRLMGVFS